MTRAILCPDAMAPDRLAVELGWPDVPVVPSLAGLAPIEGMPRRGEVGVCIRGATGAEQVVAHGRAEAAVAAALANLTATTVVLASLDAFRLDDPRIATSRLIDGRVIAAELAEVRGPLGVIVPVARMVKADLPPLAPERVTHASPFDPERLGVAAMDLKRCDLIALWSYGFTAAQAEMVERLSGRPVFLPRHALARRLSTYPA
ncbi:MAG: AroM family protein [Alphaproteobacteria bacterium]|nr:AroM family protein [Alphaproteobacteria bacterium]